MTDQRDGAGLFRLPAPERLAGWDRQHAHEVVERMRGKPHHEAVEELMCLLSLVRIQEADAWADAAAEIARLRADQSAADTALLAAMELVAAKDDTIARLRADAERMRAALKPFAAVADDFDAAGRELADGVMGIYANTVGDFRRARSAITAGK